MSISDAFQTGEHNNNLSHFMAMVNLALIDGKLNDREEIALKRMAFKLNVTEDEYTMVLSAPQKLPSIGVYGHGERLERFRDLFDLINADFMLSDAEFALLHKYAIALGFSPEEAKSHLDRFMRIFRESEDFED